MSYDIHICELIAKSEIAPGVIDVTVKSSELAENARPGQFLHIKCGDVVAMPLRRPISICDVNGDLIRFIFQIKGNGTQNLAFIEEKLDILGPLGNSFAINNEEFKKPAVIGGGIGTYPLLYLTKQLKNAKVYFGFRTKNLVTLEEDFKKICENVNITTDDGSYGFHGFAITRLIEDINKGDVDIIYACGPLPMLKAVKALALNNGIKCQLSLEERMGCGIGACLTCSCETPSDGTWKYKKVCQNGPVFWSDEVII